MTSIRGYAADRINLQLLCFEAVYYDITNAGIAPLVEETLQDFFGGNEEYMVDVNLYRKEFTPDFPGYFFRNKWKIYTKLSSILRKALVSCKYL